MKKNIIFGLVAVFVATFGIVNFANAETYQFISTSGQLSSVNADNPQEAIDTASRLALHSGVILVDSNHVVNNLITNGQGSYLYHFINTSGQLSAVRADNPQEAIRIASQLAMHSGVILIK